MRTSPERGVWPVTTLAANARASEGGAREADAPPTERHPEANVRPAHQVPDRHRSGKQGDLRRL